MTKYEIMTAHCLFDERKKKHIKEGCVYQTLDIHPEIVESFDTLDEARVALKKYRTQITNDQWPLDVREYWIQANSYDDHRVFSDDGDALDVTPMVEFAIL